MQRSWKNPLRAFPVLVLLAAYAGAAFGAAGNVQFVVGDVKLITRTGETRALLKGADVNEGDRIVTAVNAAAQIKMIDGGLIAVRPSTEMGFDNYRYAGKEDGSESAVLSLLRGGFRTITGIIGRTNKRNYLIHTETATIGIRGTDHEPMVILPPAPGQVAIAPAGTYDKVNVGIAYIRTDAGSVDIHRNQVGFAPVTKAAPVILPKIPPFYKPTPAPGPQKAKEEAKDEGKKEGQQAAATSAKAGDQQKAAAPAESAAEPIRSTAVVDPASTAPTPSTAAPAAPPATIAPVVAITATDSSGATLNTTSQTVTSSTGVTIPVTQTAAPPPVYTPQAQAAADAAAASAASLSTLLSTVGSTAASTSAATVLSAAQAAVAAARSANANLAALNMDTAVAASNASTASALASAATNQVNSATTAYSANASSADSTVATPALDAMKTANSALQAANTSVQNAAVTVTSQSGALTSAQTAAAAALALANQSLTTATSALAALSTAGIATSTMTSDLLTAAQTAATAANAAAAQARTLEAAGDLTGAQSQLAIAQQQVKVAADALTAATQVLAVVASASAAQAAANSITAVGTGYASVGSSAQASGASAVATTTAQLAAVNAQAASVASNAALAQYSNPAVKSSSYGYATSGSKAVTGGVEEITASSAAPSAANTGFLLDQNKNLVEIRNSSYTRLGSNFSSTTIQNADVKFSGGTAADTVSDPNGTYYMGRWTGGQVTVTDLATTNPSAPFTDSLGASSIHWLVGLLPGNVAGTSTNNVQQLVGSANYSLVAATHPTDGLGNVGTLNNASLTADFSAQTVDASLNLSFSATDPVNVSKRNLNLTASASKMPIQQVSFGGVAMSTTVTGVPTSSGLNNTISCSGADCAAGGYVGTIGGAFLAAASGGTTSGAVGTSAGMSYGFLAIPAGTGTTAQPFPEFINGIAVLSTSAAPSVGITPFASGVALRDELLWQTTQVAPGTNPNVTTYLVSDKYRENLFNNSSGTPSTPLTTPLTTPVTLTGPNANTNFVFDANGNLLKVLDTPHVVFDLGNDVPGSSTQFAAPTPLAHAQLSFGGGGTPAESFYDAGTGIRLGRWSGGAVDITDLSTGKDYLESLLAPGGAQRSVQWVVAQAPSSLPTTGEFHYARIAGASGAPSFATAPTDSYGNVGTLDGARLTADFTNMRASAGVRISMPSGPGGSLGLQSLSAHFENAPISSGGFNVSTGSDNPAGTDNLHVTCFGPGCAPTLASGASPYGGRIRGAFDSGSGNAGTADGAFLRYTLNTLYSAYAVTPPAGRVVDDYISGLVAFKQGPQIVMPTSAAYPTAAPTAPVVVVATYNYNAGGNNVFASGRTYWADRPSTGLTTDAAGNLISVTEASSGMHGDGSALALSGGAASPATPIMFAIGSAAAATDGNILLGWQAPTPSLSVSGIDGGGSCFGSGCAVNPSPRTVLGDGLSWVRGPAPFPDYLPSAIAGYSNSLGVVVPGSATYNLGASILHDQSGAAGSVTSAGLTVDFNKSSVAFNMAATTAAGNWTASAASVKLNQSGSFYANSGGPATIISGTTIAPATTHENLSVTFSGGGNPFGNIQGQLMGIGLGGAGVTYDLNSFAPCTSGACPIATASGSLAFGLSTAQQPYSTLTANQLVAFTTGMSAAGQYDSSENYRIQGGYVSPYRTQTVNNFPVRIDAELPVAFTASSPCTANCGPFTTGIPAVYAVAGASGLASVGTAALLESGYDLATGIRWGRYGNGTIGVNDRVSGTSLGTLDVSQQNSHFIMTSSQSGPTVLPLTGTFNYAFVGGTSPTDSKGNVGAPLTAANASLTANFSTQKVDAALNNLVVGGNTWSASASGIPIAGNIFQAEKKLGGGGNLTVTSTLGSNTSGTLAGAFTGSTGTGAALLYSLNQGGNSITNPAAVTISGVAVFKR